MSTIYLTPWGKYIDLARVVEIGKIRLESNSVGDCWFEFNVTLQLVEKPTTVTNGIYTRAEKLGPRNFRYYAFDKHSKPIRMPVEDITQIHEYDKIEPMYLALLNKWKEVTKALQNT